jgi:hypothetical protein
MAIGRKIAEWFEAAFIEEPGLLGLADPKAHRIDRVLGRLVPVGVGVAETHELEKLIEGTRRP